MIFFYKKKKNVFVKMLKNNESEKRPHV